MCVICGLLGVASFLYVYYVVTFHGTIQKRVSPGCEL